MAEPEGQNAPRDTAGAARLRSGLRRHGLVRRPAAVREMLRARALRFTEGNRVVAFDNGAEGLDAMLASIGTAKRYVHLETYILRSDTTGARFIDALAERAEAGVDVRLLFDSLGSRGLDRRSLTPLRSAGGQVAEFNPPSRWIPDFAPRRRDHRKILVVDGRCAYVGGLNLGDEYAAKNGDRPAWRDAHLRLEGPAVRDLDAVFLESWFRADAGDLAWDTLLSSEPAPVGDTRCAILADGPAYRRRRMRELLISALDEARARVLLVSPYLAPGHRVLAALERAGERGVAVDLLIAGLTDHPVLRRGARSFVPRLAARGVRIFEDTQRMMHAKVAVFDDDFAIVGTSNLDRQSFDHSYEVNVILEGSGLANAMRERFSSNLPEAARLDVEMLARRGPLERLVDWLAAQLLRFV